MMKTLALMSVALAASMHPVRSAAQDSPTVLHLVAHLVEVPATVLDSRGHYVDELGRDDFNILENGQPQTLKYFASSGDSLKCAILLDTTGSMTAVLPRLKNSVVRFIDQLGAEDSVAIYSFSESVVTQQELTKDKAEAKRAVLRLHAGGRTALYDALSEVTLEISHQSGKKAILVFTDGDDNASVLPVQAATGRAIRNAVPLFTIAEGEATQSEKLKKTLTDLSKSTGGQTYEVKELKDIEEIFTAISSTL
jgi:Ca-activated chloride channel family protein